MSKVNDPSQAPDFVPNPDGMSNLEYQGGTSFQAAPPDDELADTGDGGMSDDEAVAFLSRPVAEFGTRRGQR